MSTTFSRGDIVINRIVELEVPFADALSFLPGLQPDVLAEHRSWLAPTALDPDGKLIFCFQSYIVRTPHHTILVDSCVGNHKNRTVFPAGHMKNDETYMRALASAGLTVEDIDFVLCTHLHFDHVGWNTRLADGRWVPTFPNARYLFAQREYAHWIERHAKTPIAYIADSVLPIVEAKQAELVRSDHALDDHVRLLPTPGHTPDHFSVCLGRGGDDVIITGDVIHSPLQARYPELSMRADYDPKQAAATRRGLLERCCDTDTLCCTAHFPTPSGGRIRRSDDGFRCEPVPPI
jgi:glyoxylase-like metal-dependent hydrolase (beta-lactamase superfamily II)